MFPANPWYYELRKEVRKEMAIDFRKEWKAFRAKNGHCYLVPDPGSMLMPTHTVGNAMDTQIRNTILNRERLMEEYVKEQTLTTDIVGGNKEYHDVKIIDKRYGTLICTRAINKLKFNAWCKKKGGK